MAEKEPGSEDTPIPDQIFEMPLVKSGFTIPFPEARSAAVDLDSLDPASMHLDELHEGVGRTGRYLPRGEIGRGGMGAVLEVFDTDLRRALAMKVILGRAGTAAGDTKSVPRELLMRFVEEAQVTGQLEHPGIVPVHELGIDAEGRIYFTMQVVKGEDFAKIIKRIHAGDGEWTVTRGIGVLQKVCDAMAYAHDKGVVHRDLKPANIMVGRYGQVYVMDWGLARVTRGSGSSRSHGPTSSSAPTSSHERIHTDRADLKDSQAASALHTLAGSIVGTPAFMPPEQALGHLDMVDERSDVYAVGAMLYHLLSGHVQYHESGVAMTAEEWLERVRREPPASLASMELDASPELVAIGDKAMARDPDERYANMGELARDLRAFQERRVVRAYRTGPWIEARKWIQRNRLLAGALLAAVVALVVGLATSLYLKGESDRNATLAANNFRDAEAQRSQVSLQLAEVDRLSDALLVSDLQVEARTLWPPVPEMIPRYDDWLRRAAVPLARREQHVESLRSLREQGAVGPDGNELRWNDPKLRWRYETFVELVAELDVLRALASDVDGRKLTASELWQRSIGEHEQAWNEARAAVANDARYGGLDLSPQLGLVPLGADPASGLQEFGHLLSGELPARDPSTGRLVPTEASGIVLVLVPGGDFTMGAGADDTPYARDNQEEYPAHPVRLDAYFLSKYEMTQGQWLRATGTNPSFYAPDSGNWFRLYSRSGDQASLLHPVENVTWSACAQTLLQLGLELPTEAQWERAARAGERGAWSFGSNLAALASFGNVADGFAKTHGAEVGWECDEELDDGFTAHAPVGSFAPNAFGLHDVHGNVWEWCRDRSGLYVLDVAPGDGERRSDGDERVIRSGCFERPAPVSRSSSRERAPEDYALDRFGLRPARSIDGVERSSEVAARWDELARRGWRAYREGGHEVAERWLREALETQVAQLGERHPDTLMTRAQLGVVYDRGLGRGDEGERLLSEVLAVRREELGDDHRDTLIGMSALGNLYALRGSFERAATHYAEAYERSRDALGENNPDTLQSLFNLAELHVMRFRRWHELEPMLVELFSRSPQALAGLDANLASLGQSPRLAEPAGLVDVYRGRIEGERALAILTDAHDVRTRELGEDHVFTLIALHRLGQHLQRAGRREEAEAAFAQALELSQGARAGGEADPATLFHVEALARFYAELEQWEDAEAMAAWWFEALPVADADRARARTLLDAIAAGAADSSGG